MSYRLERGIAARQTKSHGLLLDSFSVGGFFEEAMGCMFVIQGGNEYGAPPP